MRPIGIPDQGFKRIAQAVGYDLETIRSNILEIEKARDILREVQIDPPSGEDEDVNEVVQRASNDLQQVEELLNQLLGYLDFLESGGDISEYELW